MGATGGTRDKLSWGRGCIRASLPHLVQLAGGGGTTRDGRDCAHVTFWGVATWGESGTSIPRSLSLYGGGEVDRLTTETHRDAAESWEGGRQHPCGPGRAGLPRACAGHTGCHLQEGRHPSGHRRSFVSKHESHGHRGPWVSSNPKLPQVCMRPRLGDPGTGRVLVLRRACPFGPSQVERTGQVLQDRATNCPLECPQQRPRAPWLSRSPMQSNTDPHPPRSPGSAAPATQLSRPSTPCLPAPEPVVAKLSLEGPRPPQPQPGRS